MNLNERFRRRAILLTPRELEPWHAYDRAKSEFKIDPYASSAEQLALATAAMYFSEPATNPQLECGINFRNRCVSLSSNGPRRLERQEVSARLLLAALHDTVAKIKGDVMRMQKIHQNGVVSTCARQ